VTQQWPENAAYHDIIDLLSSYDEETITMIYRDLQEETGDSIRYYGVETYDTQIFNIFGYLADKSLLLVAGIGDYAPEDEFVEIIYITQSGQELSYQAVLDRSDDQNRQDPIYNTKTVYKDTYFDSMFYRTYIGINQTNEDGSISEPSYQIPCINMKHFYAQYISPYPEYAVSQGKSAVVIAKYYEGAEINGTISFNGENKDFQLIVQHNITHYGNQIPVDHDRDIAMNGSYEVIVPAGVSTLQIRRYPELITNAFVVQNVTFNSLDETSSLTPITEEEATRTGSYQRTVDIDIIPGDISGFVYDDIDGNDGYNLSSDVPLSGFTVQIIGIDSLDPSTGQPLAYDYSMIKTITSDENGYYNASDLIPGYYQIIVNDEEGFQIQNTLYPIPGGVNTFDIVKPKPGNVEGTIFFDSDGNGAYNSGEEMNNVNVDLIYMTTGNNNIISSLTTDADGSYQFTNLIPGNYGLQMEKLPDYNSIFEITINENQTTKINASIQYAVIGLTGVTKNENTMQDVANITITFAPSVSIDNNSAQPGSIRSDTNGDYALDLMPGTYNVSVYETVVENNVNVTYSYDQTFTLVVGQGSRIYDVLLARQEE